MKNFRRIVSVLLCLAMIFSLASSFSYAAELRNETPKAKLNFVTISDPHFYPESLMGGKGEAWQKYASTNTKQFAQSEQMMRTAIETAVARNPELDYILIPGDLTKDGEYVAHTEFAALLEALRLGSSPLIILQKIQLSILLPFLSYCTHCLLRKQENYTLFSAHTQDKCFLSFHIFVTENSSSPSITVDSSLYPQPRTDPHSFCLQTVS